MKRLRKYSILALRVAQTTAQQNSLMETPSTGQGGQQYQQQIGQQQPVPNAIAALVLGILSIVFCWCYGLIGLILGIIAVVLAGKGRKLYEANPGLYTVGSFNNLKAGRICGIIGICLSSVYVVFIIVYVLIIGAALTGAMMTPWDQM